MEAMLAAVLERRGDPPVLRDVEPPQRRDGQALVRVSAAGINPIDISIGNGRFYGPLPDTPYVPGREGVGTVLEGARLSEGARVRFEIASPPGAFAELAAVDEESAVELPEGLDDAVAAGLGIAGLAGWLALEWRARVQEGETVLVLGASGVVGQVAVQGARLMGAGHVVAAARSEEGLARARELGADATVPIEGDGLEERLREACDGRIDVIVDPLWGAPAVAALRAAPAGARLVQIGQSAGAEATVPSGAVRGKLLSILGYSTHGVPAAQRLAAYRRMAEHVVAGRLRIDVERVSLAQADDAWRRQERSPGRKLVLVP
jgi:NADPH:quinone reductase